MNETGRATCRRRARPTLSCRPAAGRSAPPGSALAPAGSEPRPLAAPAAGRPAGVRRPARDPRQAAALRRVPLGCRSPGASERRGPLRPALGGRGRSSPGARRTGGWPPRPSGQTRRRLPSPVPRLTGAERERGRPPPARRQAGYLCRGLRAILAPAAGGGGRGSPRPPPPPLPAAGLRPGAPPPRTGVPRSRGRRRRKQVEIKE